MPSSSTANDKVIADIRNFLAAPGVDSDDVQITLKSAEGADEGQTFDLSDPNNKLRMFKIDISVPFDSISSFPVTFMDSQVLRASLTMRAGNTALVD